MTTSLTVPFLLPQDLLLIPVAELAPASRATLDARDGDVAITRPRSRKASSVIDRDSAALLQGFRDAKTIVQAVADFSREREVDPHAVLNGALPVLRRLISARLLVPASAEESLARPIVASFERGDAVGQFEILHNISLLFDVELYQARAANGRLCLLKVARSGGGERIVRSLEAEGTLLGRLKGLPVPSLVELGQYGDLPFLAIEWRSGVHPTRAAEELRAAHDEASRRRLLALCIDIASAYAQLHDRNVAHGDVHDMNILIGRRGDVTLVDFGQAYVLDDPEFYRPPRGGVLANYDPEMAAASLDDRHAPIPTFASEQYAVGTLLYAIATGQDHLELSVRREAALKQILLEPPRSFASSGVPAWPALESVLKRMLEKEPSNRFASMHDVASALRGVEVASALRGVEVATDVPTAATTIVAPSRVARFVFDRLKLNGGLFSSELSEGPHCSINNGAAGIAHAWYRLALLREDADALSIAAAWSRRARDWMDKPEAFFLEDKTIAPKNVGRAALFHSATGVHCVRALVAHAEGDDAEARRACTAFIAAARVRCAKWDLTLGRAGALLGAALQYEAEPNLEPRVGRFGNTLAAALERRLAKAAPIRTSHIDAIGMAHGWAGGLYALLRWSQATGRPISTFVIDRVAELAALGNRAGRGASWPRFRDQRDGTLQATWCNGDTGLVFLWLLASELLDNPSYLALAEDAGWNVADRGPDRTIDLCCGSAGRAYGFLALYRRTGDETWLRRAKRFADHSAREVDPDADDAHRLYKGALGVALLINELETPRLARMPVFESEGWQWHRPTRGS